MTTALIPDPPLIHHGQLLLGPSLDGTEYATYNLFDSSRAHHGLLLGDEWNGIRNLVAAITVAARASQPVITLYLSAESVAHDAELARHATRAAYDHFEHDLVLTALENLADERERFALRHNLCSLIGQRPLIHVVLDGAEQVIHPDRLQRWFALTRRGGKLGIAILAVVYSSAVQFCTAHTGLRNDLAYSNVIAIGAHVRQSYAVAQNLGLGDISDLGDSGARLHQPGLAAPITFQPFAVPDRSRALAHYPDAVMDESHRRLLDHR